MLICCVYWQPVVKAVRQSSLVVNNNKYFYFVKGKLHLRLEHLNKENCF